MFSVYMKSDTLKLFSCCLDSKLWTKLADKASFYGNHSILDIIQNIEDEKTNSLDASTATGLCGFVTNLARSWFSPKLPHKLMMENAIKSDSAASVVVVSQMMRKNGITVTSAMKQTAQKRGVSKIIETLTGVPYDAEHEKENVRLSIQSGYDKTIAGSLRSSERIKKTKINLYRIDAKIKRL